MSSTYNEQVFCEVTRYKRDPVYFAMLFSPQEASHTLVNYFGAK